MHALAAQHTADPALGLAPSEVQLRVERHGANELQSHARRGPLALLLEQFTDFMVLVLVLLAAAVISGVIGDLVDALAILVIVLLNAVIGFVQTWRADRAMAALQQLAAAQATVLRGGQIQVPADLRLIDNAQLRVDESALTGESVTVAKHTAALPDTGDSALGDRLNMAFKGTTATHGRARGLVVATGMATELGKVARLLDTDDRSTPLQQRPCATMRARPPRTAPTPMRWRP